MRKMLVAVVIWVVFIGLVSASVVGFLSNLTTVGVVVSEPTFYFDGADIIGDGSFSLKLNNDSVGGGSFVLDPDNNDYEELYSENLSVDGFYPLDIEMTIDVEMNGLDGSFGENASIRILVFLSGVEILNCGELSFGVNGERKQVMLTCDVGDALVNIEPTDRIMVKFLDSSPSGCETEIYFGSSKMRLVAR